MSAEEREIENVNFTSIDVVENEGKIMEDVKKSEEKVDDALIALTILQDFADRYLQKGNKNEEKSEEGEDEDGTVHDESNRNFREGRWTGEEQRLFLKCVEKYDKDYKKIATIITTRSLVQIRTHAQKYFKKSTSGNKRKETDFSSDEDEIPPVKKKKVGTYTKNVVKAEKVVPTKGSSFKAAAGSLPQFSNLDGNKFAGNKFSNDVTPFGGSSIGDGGSTIPSMHQELTQAHSDNDANNSFLSPLTALNSKSAFIHDKIEERVAKAKVAEEESEEEKIQAATEILMEPCLKQPNDFTCGPTCLKMILPWCKKSIEEIASPEFCNSLEGIGTPPENMKVAMKALNIPFFESINSPNPFEEVKKCVDDGYKVILRTITKSIPHWVFLQGYTPEYYIVYDSMDGIIINYSEKELKEIWAVRDYFYFYIISSDKDDLEKALRSISICLSLSMANISKIISRLTVENANGILNLSLYLRKEIQEDKLNGVQLAHIFDISSKIGYLEIIKVLAELPPHKFGHDYDFDQPLFKATRSWIQAHDGGRVSSLPHLENVIIYLICGPTQSNFYAPDKLAKTNTTCFELLKGHGSKMANNLLEKLSKIATNNRKFDVVGGKEGNMSFKNTKKYKKNTDASYKS